MPGSEMPAGGPERNEAGGGHPSLGVQQLYNREQQRTTEGYNREQGTVAALKATHKKAGSDNVGESMPH